MQKMEYEIDGNRFSTLHEFFDEISQILIPGVDWGRNLDAFDEILEGGFGTPDGGFVLVWRNSEQSKKKLGYDETVNQLEARLRSCHSSNREDVARDLLRAKNMEGPTVYEWLLEIVLSHCRGGEYEDDGVELRLK